MIVHIHELQVTYLTLVGIRLYHHDQRRIRVRGKGESAYALIPPLAMFSGFQCWLIWGTVVPV